mmetsp:Transcript_24044/g.33713  ORF Transcript_24044/g.33713 Transcript_24044/m.33713 type:complete len:155 (+) Transcript_24044:418-882(+)|eukprot:CAMPEP_0168549914 /NCGR_PEP_ID=MMETSP0413-20121227/5358_1 /TAXON_ID=136452 /ORGANISM="Filamoeba nolandi, Strain NC-AS-23-1" /LENGTH=154 /DNA_ID=CAMNT_0008580335 /DNA_START=1023 /DNA_END=1487 /DNA_ORIENTATION=+
MSANVTVKNVSSILVASIRKPQPRGQVSPFISASAISLLVFAKETSVDVNGRGFVIYHNPSDTNGDVDIEVCLPVSKAGQDRGDIKFKEVAGGSSASLIATGPYDQLPAQQEEVKKWCEANSLKYTQVREVFLKGPQETKNTAEFQTEILFVAA